MKLRHLGLRPADPFVLLVCGSRHRSEIDESKKALFAEIDVLRAMLHHEGSEIDCIVSGGASGADWLAIRWAEDRGVDHVIVPALWKKLGSSAGNRRNGVMLKYLRPSAVLAFKGGVGTKNMMAQAKARGVPVVEAEPLRSSRAAGTRKVEDVEDIL